MALSIVRITNLTAYSMSVVFNDDVDTDVGINNVSILTAANSVDNPEIISLEVVGSVVNLEFRPLFPNLQYKLVFSSTTLVPFASVNGEVISEDGNRNVKFFTSPGEDDSEIRDNMVANLPSIYDADEPTMIRSLVTTMAQGFQRSADAIATTRAGNYLSVLVEDERVTRGTGPTDKLDNGGAFEILRVASTPTLATIYGSMEFNADRAQSFQVRANMYTNPIIETLTADPISLQATDVINEKVTDDTSLNNHFSGLLIKVSNRPVIQLISVSLKRDGEWIEYNIERFGYILKSNRYDTVLSGINVNLADNEIELASSSITGLEGGFVQPRAGDEIRVSYIYQKLGRDVDPETVSLTTIKQSIREVVPAIINRFSLDHAPIVDSSDEIYVSGGVSFLSTQSTDTLQAFTSAHPAFSREIKYDVTRFPARAGEFAIDYSTGAVVVFGEDETNDGTGVAPPVATYTYRNVYTKDLDFTFNSDRDELAIKSTRNIEAIEAKITFNYEDTFASDEDYRISAHVEVLNERVNNKLIDDFKIRTDKFPITNVFRILNETTGELYSVTRFNDTDITFSGRLAPRQVEITRERALFTRVPQEVLLIAEETTNSSSLRIFKFNLENNGITDSQNRFVGANFDTSVLFSDSDVFIREFFYESELYTSVATNLNKLSAVGDYCIDYSNGIVYVAVSSTQGSDVGDISYQHQKIKSKRSHILGVNNVYRSYNSLQPNVTNYVIGEITDITVSPFNLENVGERFINGNKNRVLIVGTHQSGEDGITTVSNNLFTSNTGVFDSSDLGRTLRVGSASQTPVEEVTITGIVNSHQVTTSASFTATGKGRVWVVIDTSTGAAKTLAMDNDIVSVKEIYLVSQLGSLPAASLDGYYDINRDSIDGNVITLGDTNPLVPGDAVLVNYNYGNLYIDYTYLRDELIVSYEYGNNGLDWSISDTLVAGQEYYVTYKYGALRDSLLLNFGAPTQISQLTNFSPNLNRELYRSITGGTLQSFVEGPTLPSISRLVEAFTDVEPNITEAAFSNWVLGRDYLHPRPIEYGQDAVFDLGKFNNGLIISDGQTVHVPAVANIKLSEGTLETWVRPQWKGQANDAILTFSLEVDGYADASKIFIGFAGVNPATVPFDLNLDSTDIEITGEPSNISSDTGFFVWYDDSDELWHLRWQENRLEEHSFSGSVESSGEFFGIVRPVGEDGYSINEVTDAITSTISKISFEAFIDGYDADRDSALYGQDGISFGSGDVHYLFDMAHKESSNRMSIFKDGTGYLNFQVFDNAREHGFPAGFYNLSTNVSDWQENELHHIAVSWDFNNADEMDSMHLFIDGMEVPNLFKYGGNPKASSQFDYGDVAEETVIASTIRPIVGGFDGITVAGSYIFRVESGDFTADGIEVGDYLYLLDDTPDGEGDPNSGLPYQITGVGTDTVTLDRAPTLTLGDLHYSINQVVATVTTPINFQEFIVVTVDENGVETELSGEDADESDYSVRRGNDYSHVISINNGSPLGNSVLIKPIGLIFKRCRIRSFVYGGENSEIRVNSPAPVSLQDVDITAIILGRTLIQTGGGFGLVGTVIGAQLVTLLQSRFDSVCQPSNSSAGRKLKVRLAGDNINYNIPGNQVIIEGTTYSGAISETLSFSENDAVVTSEYWTRIDSVIVSIVPIDATVPAGTVEIGENLPITESENNGDFAEVVQYANGIFVLETYGTGGLPFYLEPCLYEIDYPTFLRIHLDRVPDTFTIGSDFENNYSFDGIIDEFRILDQASIDTRAGETIALGERSVTTDYNAEAEFTEDNNTLLLLHYDDETDNSADYVDRFNNGYEVAPSVNSEFGTGIRFSRNNPFVISNAASTFNNNEGTIEFWISPLDDTKGDPGFHYYVDMTSVVQEFAESDTSVTVIAGQRVRSIESVRLATDVFNTGTNYFTGGSVSNIDNKTITLGVPLPAQNSAVKITYVPFNSQGDRVSIYRDDKGYINFFMKASGVEHVISVYADWSRHTWHRVMAMWRTNSSDNRDRLRLFVDGNERGTIRYGTGLIYGTGIVYGQAEVRPGVNRFLVDNIDLVDTFASIYVGANTIGLNGARAVLDNLRFSDEERLQSIRQTSNDTIDINYQANTSLAIPVIDDITTTALYNFNTTKAIIEHLATIINAERGIFRFKVEVVDSFDKVIGNTELEDLLKELINTIKPAHTEAVIKFTK